MKKHKTLIAFIILVLLLGVYLAVTLYSSILSYMEISTQADLKVSGIVDTLNRVQDRIDALETEFHEKAENFMELMCTALRPLINGNRYEGPEIFDDGVVVKAENGSIVYPEGFSGRFELLNEASDLNQLQVMTDTTLLDDPDNSRPVLISAKEMGENYWYIDWWEMDDYRSSINYEQYLSEAITTLEKLYDAKLVLVDDQADEKNILYTSKAFGSPESLAELGITDKEITDKTPNITLGDNIYTATYEELNIFNRSLKAIVLLNPVSSNAYIIKCIIIAAGFMLLSITVFILWIHWIDVYSKDHELTEYQKKMWQIGQLRKTAVSFSLIGAVILFVILIGYQLLGNLSRISNSNQESLNIIMARLENSSTWVASSKNEDEEWGIYYARRIANLYARIPEIRNKDFLATANKLIGSSYIMVFDRDGKELLSSNGYIGFVLGDGVNTNEDFQYLLKGFDHIISEPATEKYSGKRIQMMGVSMDMEEETSYGAVIVAIDSEITQESAEAQNFRNYVRMVTHQGNLSFIISQDNGKVAYTSDQEFAGRVPAEFGLDTADLIPTSLKTFEIEGIKHFGAFDKDDHYLYFFMTESQLIWGDAVGFALYSAAAFMLILMLVCLYLLGPSRVNITGITEEAKEKLKKTNNFSLDQETLNSFKAEKRGSRSPKEWWHDLTPEQRIGYLANILLVFIFLLLFIIIIGTDTGSRSVTNFILTGNWVRGLNGLALIAIICILFLLCTFILIKSILVKLLCSVLKPKGKTIVGLISSLLQYIAIITSVFMCLAYLGIDTSVLITSASVLTLAISLGSKDLVADILAGIFIIFEGDFQVGDIIEVNGFKGSVLDIGVRSTKMIDSSHNIKIIDNQNIKNILNLSKENTWFTIMLTVLSSQPLKDVEELLVRELPKIGEMIPTITAGPQYQGIESIEYRRVSVMITAECRQQDLRKTKRALNHALWDLMKDNGYQL